MARALIFDFDGVVADSEVLSNTVLAEIVTELGKATTVEDAYRDYMGKRFHEVIAAIEKAVGRALPHRSVNIIRVGPWSGSDESLRQLRACESSLRNSSICLAASHRPPHRTGLPSVLRLWK